MRKYTHTRPPLHCPCRQGRAEAPSIRDRTHAWEYQATAVLKILGISLLLLTVFALGPAPSALAQTAGSDGEGVDIELWNPEAIYVDGVGNRVPARPGSQVELTVRVVAGDEVGGACTDSGAEVDTGHLLGFGLTISWNSSQLTYLSHDLLTAAQPAGWQAPVVDSSRVTDGALTVVGGASAPAADPALPNLADVLSVTFGVPAGADVGTILAVNLTGDVGARVELDGVTAALPVCGAFSPPDPTSGDDTGADDWLDEVYHAQVEVVGGLEAMALAVDDSSGNGNGLVEPGEVITLAPTWSNPAAFPVAGVNGSASSADPVLFQVASASYGDVPAGGSSSCLDDGGACYELGTTGPRPASHWDVSIDEQLSTGDSYQWPLHVGASFADVPVDYWTYRFVETILHAGITAGCGPAFFCPEAVVNRWQMVVFISKAMVGNDPIPVSGVVPGMGPYDCSSGGLSVFSDIDPEEPACRSIHYLAAEGVTAGCGAGRYCPGLNVSRAQMSVFLVKGFNLSLYGP